eukprot:2709496-Pyramimonas_sp.AAC.1
METQRGGGSEDTLERDDRQDARCSGYPLSRERGRQRTHSERIHAVATQHVRSMGAVGVDWISSRA